MTLAAAGCGAGGLEGFRLYRLPMPPRRAPISITGGGYSGSHEIELGPIEWRLVVLDKPRGSRRGNEDTEFSQDEQWLRAIWSLSGRIHAVQQGLEDAADSVWEHVEKAFLEPYGRGYEPTMDVLIEHARVLYPLLAVLTESPRKVLRRAHRNVPIGAVVEMDGKTLRWLSKQPGRDTAERAGTRQTVLAPVREENLDTLENRTLRSLAEMSVRLVGEHLGEGRMRMDPRKTDLLSKYRQRCRTLDRDFHLRGVRLIQPGVAPNYVLQHDARYRVVWGAWQALLDHGRARDLVWTWQSRSWDELCLLFAIVACRLQPHLMAPIVEMPFQVRSEQREGRWIARHDPAAVFFPIEDGSEWTVEVRTPMENGSGAPPGTAACLELKTWDGRTTTGRMPIYALHSFRDGAEDEDLAGLERACALMERKDRGLGPVYGVALRSVMNGSDEPVVRRDGKLMRAAFAPDSELWTPMNAIGRHIEEWIGNAAR